LKVLIASSSILSIPLFNVLSNSSEYEITGLLTNQDKPTGRGQKIGSNELAVWAQSQNFDIFKSSSEDEMISALTKSLPEIVITIAFGQLVKEKVLRIPKFGWINIHFSILPKWRGAAPVQHSILNGEQSTGISIFKLDQGMDTGPIYLSKEFSLKEDETTTEVLNRLSVEGSEMTLDVLKMIEDRKQPKDQSNTAVSFAPKFQKKDGEINWKKSSESIYNLYRALGSNPGIWTVLNGVRLKIDRLRRSDVQLQLSSGQIEIDSEKIYAGTSEGVIEVLQVTPAGRNSMSSGEFVRGLTSKVGLNFG
jgi:methionyl-tRNA formyltransferase